MNDRKLKDFTIMPEGGRWYTRPAYTMETAYGFECSWYGPNTRIAVRDNETGETKIFTRELDNSGNLVKVNIV